MTATLTPLEELAPVPEQNVPVVGIETITPEYAAEILDNWNHNPRRLRKDKAAQYSADMESGRWEVGIAVVAFDEDGMLVDGQHRMAACVLAGTPFTTLVSRGVGQAAVDNADRGMKRAVGDILRGKGEVNVSALQAAINLSCIWDMYGVLSNYVPTWPQLEDWLAANPDIRSAVAESMATTHPPLSVRTSIMAPFTYRIRQVDNEQAHIFMKRFASGVELAPGDAILKLRDVFLRRGTTVYGRPSRAHDLALLIKAWNGFITGKEVRTLKWNRGGVRQEPFPFIRNEDNVPHPFPDFLREQQRIATEGVPEEEDETVDGE